jgi:hypothetical protein
VLADLVRINARPGSVGLGEVLQLAGKAQQLKAHTGALEPVGFSAPTVALAFQLWSLYYQASLDVMQGRPEAALRRLEPARRSYPEALLGWLEAGAWFAVAKGHLLRNEKDALRRALEQVSERGRQAAEAPTLAPQAPFRYQARFLAAAADAFLAGEMGNDRRPERLLRLRDNVRRLVVEGRPFPETRQHVLPMLAAVLEPELGRMLLADWQLEEPDSLVPLRERAKLELRAGSPAAALRAARQVLARAPQDAEMLDVQRQARTPPGPP